MEAQPGIEHDPLARRRRVDGHGLADAQRAVPGEVVARLLARTEAHAAREGRAHLAETLNATLFHERARLARASELDARALGDRVFFTRLGRAVRRADDAALPALLRSVLEHYMAEIRGRLDPRFYAAATRALPWGLTGLLNGLSPRRTLRALPSLPRLDDRLVIEGETEALRALSARGTVILAPAYGSDLDAVVLGHVIYKLGMAPFAYGAGLPLLDNPVVGPFLRHLGAYSIDVRKTDPLYRDALKEYAVALLERGQHLLFFPAGARSGSGALETRLKRGLLGAGLTALRNQLMAGRRDAKVFVVPCVCSYPLVLEAATLVGDYLEAAGRGRYHLAQDEFDRIRRWTDFLGGLLALDVRVHVRVGAALDALGNDVSPDGTSRDPRGRPLDPARYLLVRGKVTADPARDAEYTSALAERLVRAYRRDAVAQPTHALAWACFELLRREDRGQDLYRFLRGLGPDTALPVARVETELGAVLEELTALAREGAITLSPELALGDARAALAQGLRALASYHSPPVLTRRGGAVMVHDASLLFYYRNRLEGYGLRGAPALVGTATA